MVVQETIGMKIILMSCLNTVQILVLFESFVLNNFTNTYGMETSHTTSKKLVWNMHQNIIVAWTKQCSPRERLHSIDWRDTLTDSGSFAVYCICVAVVVFPSLHRLYYITLLQGSELEVQWVAFWAAVSNRYIGNADALQ